MKRFLMLVALTLGLGLTDTAEAQYYNGYYGANGPVYYDATWGYGNYAPYYNYSYYPYYRTTGYYGAYGPYFSYSYSYPGYYSYGYNYPATYYRRYSGYRVNPWRGGGIYIRW